jgi:hypothetical protein
MSFGLVLLSAVIAVVLWMMATAVEMHLQRNAALQRILTEPSNEPKTGTGKVIEPDSSSCQDIELRLRRTIDDARFCSTDDDCTLFDYGYPIDCMTSVAKSQISLLREEYSHYDEKCRYRVFYDCPTEPYVRLALCRNNRCVVELDRNDALQDSTLDLPGEDEPRHDR